MKDGTQKKLIALKLKDLNSLISFNLWLTKNIKYYKDKSPSEGEILVILNFIKKKLFGSNLPNKKDYLESIKKINKRIRSK